MVLKKIVKIFVRENILKSQTPHLENLESLILKIGQYSTLHPLELAKMTFSKVWYIPKFEFSPLDLVKIRIFTLWFWPKLEFRQFWTSEIRQIQDFGFSNLEKMQFWEVRNSKTVANHYVRLEGLLWTFYLMKNSKIT